VIWSTIGCVMVEMAVAVAVAFGSGWGGPQAQDVAGEVGWQWLGGSGYLLSLKWCDLEHYWLSCGFN
jgi:hypothetical protein